MELPDKNIRSPSDDLQAEISILKWKEFKFKNVWE